jgi:hypothetical protein
MIVPTVAASASVTAQSITPIDLCKKYFVTPSVKKSSKRKKSSSSSIVLAEHEHSSGRGSDNSSIVYVRAKKKRKRKTWTNKNKIRKTTKLLDLVSSQNLSSGDEDEVTVVNNPAATLEVETEVRTQVLPQMDIAMKDSLIGDILQHLGAIPDDGPVNWASIMLHPI